MDAERDLYVYDISRRSKIYIRNLSSLVQRYGKVVGIVPFYEDIIIAFQTNGLGSRHEAERTSNRLDDSLLSIRLVAIEYFLAYMTAPCPSEATQRIF